MSTGTPILQVEGLRKYYDAKRSNLVLDYFGLNEYVKAVDGVSFEIGQGETLGLVGESGCGKTTIGKCIVRLTEPTEGEIRFRGEDVTAYSGAELRAFRKQVQFVFQDPQSSLNRRKKIGQIVGGPLEYHGIASGVEKRERVHELLDDVNLPRQYYHKYPHQLSGGQQQRVDIARALSLDPELVILDEPVSALDVSVQAQILNLLMDLQDEYDLSYLCISHDLSVIRHMADRVAVMYLGELVEEATETELFTDSKHPYTNVLLSSVPRIEPEKRQERVRAGGRLPTPINPPSGCRFHPRCPEIIRSPELDVTDDQWRTLVAFHRFVDGNFTAQGEGFGDLEDVRSQLRRPRQFVEEWFGSLPPDVETGLVTVCELAADGDHEAASDRLDAVLESPCKRTEPPLATAGGARDVRCHIYETED